MLISHLCLEKTGYSLEVIKQPKCEKNKTYSVVLIAGFEQLGSYSLGGKSSLIFLNYSPLQLVYLHKGLVLPPNNPSFTKYNVRTLSVTSIRV